MLPARGACLGLQGGAQRGLRSASPLPCATYFLRSLRFATCLALGKSHARKLSGAPLAVFSGAATASTLSTVRLFDCDGAARRALRPGRALRLHTVLCCCCWRRPEAPCCKAAITVERAAMVGREQRENPRAAVYNSPSVPSFLPAETTPRACGPTCMHDPCMGQIIIFSL